MVPATNQSRPRRLFPPPGGLRCVDDEVMTEGAGSRVAWVTGASRGMGANIAVQLAAAGFDVALTARDQTLLDGVATRSGPTEGAPCRTRPTSPIVARCQAFADAALAEFSRCDVLCNNGVYQGPGMRQLVVDLDLDELVVSFEADVVAPVLLCQRAITSMLAHGGGTILNMSSSSVFLDPPGTRRRERMEPGVRRRQGRHRSAREHPQRGARRSRYPGVHRRARLRRLRRTARSDAGAATPACRSHHPRRSVRPWCGSRSRPTPTAS